MGAAEDLSVWRVAARELALRGVAADQAVDVLAAWRPPWMEHAACRGHGTGLFFDASRRAEALAICARCPVPGECKAWAGDTAWGVWAGEARGRTRPVPAGPAACSTPGCARPVTCRGLCVNCYQRARARARREAGVEARLEAKSRELGAVNGPRL